MKEVLLETSSVLSEQMPYAADTVHSHVEEYTKKWDLVHDLSAQRRKRLQEILNLHQVHWYC